MNSVLILGATSDIAMAIGEIFAQNKFNLILASRNSTRLEPFCRDLNIRYNIKCEFFEFDALDFNSHAFFINHLDPLPEITVCAFGYLGDQLNAEKEWTESHKIIGTNYTAAVSILNLVSQKYSQQRKGHIIGISSVAGDRGRQSNYIYGSAKAGFTTYLSGLRNKLYSDQVHVLTVKPGFVKTKMTEHLKLPNLLTATPEEVAKNVYSAFKAKQNTVHTYWIWKWIMLIIKTIPESIFKKLKL